MDKYKVTNIEHGEDGSVIELVIDELDYENYREYIIELL